MSIGPFEWLDPPPIPVINQPPPIPTFIDGVLVHQTDLNALVANIQYLQSYVLGGSQGGTDPKPMTVLRALTPNTFTAGAATALTWDTADVNNDGAWSASDPTTVYVQTEGFYRVNFQLSINTSTHSQSQMYILINGTDVANNSVCGTRYFGIQANLEVTVPLAATASIQVAYMFQGSGTRSSFSSIGGCRLEIEWVAPTIPVQSK